jgi:hypothetical protein
MGTVAAGSVVILLFDKPEWRVAVGMLSFLIGIVVFFILGRRIWR